MLIFLKYYYNTSRYISSNYSTGPKLIHEGVRSYLKKKVPRETKNVPVSVNLDTARGTRRVARTFIWGWHLACYREKRDTRPLS